MTSIADLPVELVVEVASHLAAADDAGTSQISLALTCRRFYNSVIHGALLEQVKEIEKLSSHSRISPPLYNSPNGSRIGPSSEILLFQRDFGNNILRFIASGMTTKEFRSLRCFVCRSVKLRRLEIFLLLTEPSNLKEVARLVGTCAAKPDLSLRISGGINGHLRSPFDFHFREEAWDAGANPEASSVESKNPHPTYYSVTQRKHDFNDDSFPKAQLCELFLDGELPFLLPLYPVIKNSLNSPITTLSISGMPPSVTLFHWGQIMPSITLPCLRDITLQNLLIAFPDLLAFLERHQTIRTLDLTDNNVIGVVRLPPQTFLPHLFSLTANAEYLLPFIKHKKLGYLPSLEMLHANPCGQPNGLYIDQYPVVPDELRQVYDSLSEQAHSLSLCITISPTATIGLVRWLLDAVSESEDQTPKASSSPTSTPLACVRQITIKNPNLFTSSEITRRLTEWFENYIMSLRDKMTDEEELMYSVSNEKKIEVLLWAICLQLTMVKIGERESIRDYSSKLGYIL